MMAVQKRRLVALVGLALLVALAWAFAKFLGRPSGPELLARTPPSHADNSAPWGLAVSRDGSRVLLEEPHGLAIRSADTLAVLERVPLRGDPGTECHWPACFTREP